MRTRHPGFNGGSRQNSDESRHAGPTRLEVAATVAAGSIPHSHTVPVASAANVVAAAAPRVAATALCDHAHFDAALLDDPNARLPIRQLIALYEAAARLTRDPAFGLHVGERLDLRRFQLFGCILLHSVTLGSALERAARYLPLWTDGARFVYVREGSTVCLSWHYAEPGILEPRHDSEMSFATIAQVCRRFARGDAFGLREVRFRHDQPRERSEHRRVLGAPVQFGQPVDEMIFDDAALANRQRHAEDELCELLLRYADHLLERPAAAPPDAVERARRVLRRNLLTGHTRLAELGQGVSSSTRTLQRTLRAHGTTYRALLADVRRELAEEYLLDSGLDISEIAWRLGYSQRSEFHRAFRAWSGTTPARFRASSGGPRFFSPD